jgi:hypothetical protein
VRAFLIAIAACGASSAPPAPSRAAGELPPLPATEPPAQAMGTLASDILARARDSATRTSAYPELIGDLLAQAAVTGRLDDYVEADRASARWVGAADGDPDAHVARAKVHATLHRFADARAELGRARAAGANASTIALARVDLDQATGAPVLAAREETARLGPSLVSLTMLALARDERGDPAAALALMPQALATWHDVSAVPFTWFLFQWGRLAEDADDATLARAAYAEAWRRLPRYGEAGRHLAALELRAGDDARARAILDALDASDPHPETTAMRAELAARAHDPRAAQLAADARAGWQRYLDAYPAAFSDHAARFYLGVGADPARALALAEANLANRDTAEAAALVVEAALAAGAPARACEVGAHLVARGPARRRERFAAWKAFATCGRTADADRLAAELGITTSPSP